MISFIKIEQSFSLSPHGRMSGPTGAWEYIIVIASIIIVLVAACLCVRFFLLPREKEPDHIKKRVLDDGPAEQQGDDS